MKLALLIAVAGFTVGTTLHPLTWLVRLVSP